MKYKDITQEEIAAIIMFREMGMRVTEAVGYVQRSLQLCRGNLRRAVRCVELGAEQMRQRMKTVSFEKAVKLAMKEREGLRKRTQSDFRYLTQRFLKVVPGLAARRVRSVSSKECAQWLELAFSTPSQRKKGRAALSCVFSTAVRFGYCDVNPVNRVRAPRVREKRMRILSRGEIQELLRTAGSYKGGICLPAVAIMLYAGVRPQEVARLTWEDVHQRERCIHILPRHSKTGGARQVTIYEPLARILQRICCRKQGKICPPDWRRHWQALHRAAGWCKELGRPWQPDVLRHTFASCHLATFHSYERLQQELGHRSSRLLRTRYLSAVGEFSIAFQ